MKLSIIIASTLLAFSGAAAADDSGFYLYGSAGKSTAGLDHSAIDTGYANIHGLGSLNSMVDGSPSAYQMQFGYQFNKTSAIEVGYGSLGNLTYTLTRPTSVRESEKIKNLDLVYAVTIPLDNNFAFTSRAGLAYSQSSGQGAIRDFDGHATRITGGLGVKYNINDNLSLRADWNGYTAPPAAKIDGGFISMFTLGIGYKF